MSFWNPARMGEDKQLELDKRVILNIAKEKLEKDLMRVQKKIDVDTEKYSNMNVFSMTRKQIANCRVKRDNLAFERNEIQRRLDLIENELQNM